MGKYNKAPLDTFQHIQINAAMLLSEFTVSTWSFDRSDLIGATTGTVSFSSNDTITDFGEDINGVPNRTYQMQRKEDSDPAISATFVAVNIDLAKMLCGGADIDKDNENHIIPRKELASTDFVDLWMVGDYSDKNGATNGGAFALHIKHAMNTAGFSWSSDKNAKGQFSAEFHGFNDLTNDEEIPYELYIKVGTAELT